MTNKDKALQWANEQLQKNELIGPIKLNAWERIEDPMLFLKTCVSRLQSGSPQDQWMVYIRLRTLKTSLNESSK
jgi:hypothetical protein